MTTETTKYRCYHCGAAVSDEVAKLMVEIHEASEIVLVDPEGLYVNYVDMGGRYDEQWIPAPQYGWDAPVFCAACMAKELERQNELRRALYHFSC